MNFIEELDIYYDKYNNTYLLYEKINLIKKFKFLENQIINNNSILNFEKIIFSRIDFSLSFKNYRYIYLLSHLNISTTLQSTLFDFTFEFFYNFIYSNEYYPHIHYLLKILTKFSTNTLENKILSLEKKPIFNTYIKDFIMLLGSIGGKESFFFLFNFLKNDYFNRDYCYLAIGKIVSYRRYPLIKRSLLKEYLNFLYKMLRKYTYSCHSNYFYYSLAEIFLFSNGINGNLLNKFSEILILKNEKNLYKNITLKILNNLLLNDNEKKLLQKLYFEIPFN